MNMSMSVVPPLVELVQHKPRKRAPAKKPKPKDGQPKAPRAKPYTYVQMDYLTEAVRKRQKILECKKTDTVVNAEKVQAWKEVTSEFNAHLTPDDGPRTHIQLKAKWKQMKRDAGKVIRRIFREWNGTGGGPQWKEKLPPLEAKIFSICPKSFLSACANKYDSDGGQIAVDSDCDEENELSDIGEESGSEENNQNVDNVHRSSHCSKLEFQKILDSTFPVNSTDSRRADSPPVEETSSIQIFTDNRQMENSLDSDLEEENVLNHMLEEEVIVVGDTSLTSTANSETFNHAQSYESPSMTKSRDSPNPTSKQISPGAKDSRVLKHGDWTHYNIPALRSKKADALTLKKGKKRKLYGRTVQEKLEQDRLILIETQRDYYIALQKQNAEKHNKEMELKNLETEYWKAKKAAEETYWSKRNEREEKEGALRMKLVQEELKLMARPSNISQFGGNDNNDFSVLD